MNETIYNAALDLGTTGIVLKIFHVRENKNIAAGEYRLPNPQSEWGSDVISRISCCPEHLTDMQNAVFSAVADIIDGAVPESRINLMTVACNTVMAHILCGIDPRPLGSIPFSPAWKGAKTLENAFGGRVKQTVILPHFSAFVGGDIIAGLLALSKKKTVFPYVLADLGTNAEIALVTREKIFCTSAAAGPAFEGTGIECGSPGIAGAVSSLEFHGGNIYTATVDKAPAATLCAGGIIDTVAVLLENGLIDKNGTFTGTDDAPAALKARIKNSKFYITPSLYLSGQDIRTVQLAKAAVRSGINLLLKRSGILPAELSAVYLAGGMGNCVSPSGARITGLMPRADIKAAGNTALEGASLALDRRNFAQTENILKKCRAVMLGGTKEFEKEFISNINFDGNT